MRNFRFASTLAAAWISASASYEYDGRIELPHDKIGLLEGAFGPGISCEFNAISSAAGRMTAGLAVM